MRQQSCVALCLLSTFDPDELPDQVTVAKIVIHISFEVVGILQNAVSGDTLTLILIMTHAYLASGNQNEFHSSEVYRKV